MILLFYDRLVREVRTRENWEEWIVYILTGIEETAEETLRLVKRINAEVETMSAEIKEKLPKIYSKKLIDLLFYEFYTKIAYIERGLSVTRKTAVNYLSSLEKGDFLTSEKIGKERIYQNKRLYDLVKYGNKETQAAIDDVNNNRNMSKTFDSVNALMEDLNA